MFLDQMKEVKTAKTSHYDSILSLVQNISIKYSELSGLIFKLGDQIGQISNKTQEVEDLCAENIKDSVQQSSTYNMMKVALYSWSHEISQAKTNLQKQITPLIKRLKSNTLQIHDMFQLKRNLGSKYNRAFTKLKMNPGNRTME
jgi:DNA primase